MKKLFKKIIVSLLATQTRRLLSKNPVKLVGVVGSMGKTSTKVAISKVLSSKFRVRWQTGNYNDVVTVPLVIFGEDLPLLLNPIAWLKLLLRNELAIAKPYLYDIVVLELGTDGPGQIIEFSKYLNLDLAIVTAITPEHMENFDNLLVVAQEELSVERFSSTTLINADLSPPEDSKNTSDRFQSYGKSASDFLITNVSRTGWSIKHSNETLMNLNYKTVSDLEVYSVSAAVIVSNKLGLNIQEIQEGIKKIRPVPGRMNLLQGKNDSTIIDDSYNASPEATLQAIKTLINFKAPHKIALLGNMNELGKNSAEYHKIAGSHCSKEINLIVTLGKEANEYLAAAAEETGCRVIRTDSPYKAGEVILENLKTRSAVLIKGSQNGVYAEEAIKSLLNDDKDADMLVRQSNEWLHIKQKQFDNQK